LDFQVLMSPGDVWTAAVTAGTDGKSRLSTSDASCTVPDTIRTNKGVDFVTDRVDPKATDVNAQTREGYIEVINMADIPAGSALFTATKHVSGVAPCRCNHFLRSERSSLDGKHQPEAPHGSPRW